jgi:hypothetical protein
MIRRLRLSVVISALVASPLVHAGMEEAERWIDEEFQPSTLSKEEQCQLERMDGRRRQGVTLPTLDLDDFSAKPSAHVPTAVCISFRHSSSPTSTGSATTGSRELILKNSSKIFTAMNWACR